MDLTPEILAYAAGLFDGEGCVLIATPYSKKNKRRYHRLDVNISQKDPRPVVWMHKHFGGRIQRSPSWKGISQWSVHDKAAEQFLVMIRPYLVLKGEQADIALAFRATVSARSGNKRMVGSWGKGAFVSSAPITESVEAYRDSLKVRLAELKEVGTA